MDLDLFDMMEGFLKISQSQQKPLKLEKFNKWKECVALTKLGWKIDKCEKDGETGLILTWKKDGREDIQMSLSFVDQRLWYEHLRKEKTNESN